MSDKQLTRRDVLKRGAAIGGAMVWAVPTMQVLNMAGAAAGEQPSSGSSPSSGAYGSVPGTGPSSGSSASDK